MYVHNNNVVQIVQQDTVLFFLWFSKCVFLIMWKCLCSLVKTSSWFNANNLTYTCLFLFSGVPCLFWEGLFLLGGLRKFKPNILFTTCTWLEWPNFLSFYIFQSIQYGDYYLTKITCIFKSLSHIVKWIKYTIFDMSNLPFSSVDFVPVDYLLGRVLL